jgi:hypothetical protein
LRPPGQRVLERSVPTGESQLTAIPLSPLSWRMLRQARGHGDTIYFAETNRYIGAGVSLGFGPGRQAPAPEGLGQTKQEVRDKLKAIHVELNIRPRPMIWSAGTWPRWCGRPRVMRAPSGGFQSSRRRSCCARPLRGAWAVIRICCMPIRSAADDGPATGGCLGAARARAERRGELRVLPSALRRNGRAWPSDRARGGPGLAEAVVREGSARRPPSGETSFRPAVEREALSHAGGQAGLGRLLSLCST